MDGSVELKTLAPDELDLVRELEGFDQMLFQDVTDMTREVRLWYKHDGAKLWSGKMDVAARCAATGEGIVVNYKTGRGKDGVRHNWQAKAESVLWWIQWRDKGMNEVRYCFAQPESPFDKLLCHTFTKEELERAEADIMESVLFALSDRGELNPDEDACRYCSAAGICPALKYKMEVFHAPPGLTMDDMTPIERGQALTDARGALDASKKVYSVLCDQAKTLIGTKDGAVRGWFMSRGREVNNVTSTKTAFGIATDLGIPESEFLARANISTSSLEKLVAKHIDSVVDPKQYVKDTFGSVITSGNAAASLKKKRSK